MGSNPTSGTKTWIQAGERAFQKIKPLHVVWNSLSAAKKDSVALLDTFIGPKS